MAMYEANKWDSLWLVHNEQNTLNYTSVNVFQKKIWQKKRVWMTPRCRKPNVWYHLIILQSTTWYDLQPNMDTSHSQKQPLYYPHITFFCIKSDCHLNNLPTQILIKILHTQQIITPKDFTTLTLCVMKKSETSWLWNSWNKNIIHDFPKENAVATLQLITGC